MKKQSLVDIVGQIDDAFIAEAANPEILMAAQRKRRRMIFVKRVSSAAACALVVISIVLAIPMLRVASDIEADNSVEIKNHIDDALISVQLSSAATDMGVLEDSVEDYLDQEGSKAEAEAASRAEEAAQKASEAEAAAKKQASEAAQKAAQAAEAASKQASEAASQTTEAATPNMTTAITEVVESTPIVECERIGSVEFYYSNHMLISLSVDTGYRLTSLVIPSEIDGEQITSFGDDFWRFCAANPNLEQVTIPDMIVSFGDISYLNKSVEVICGRGSAAEIIFHANGYTVKHP